MQKLSAYQNSYPFGSVLGGRNGNVGDYRYSVSGKENDSELKGSGNSIDFGARMYDSRLGRWLSIDPASSNYLDLSPYSFCGLNPILFKEIDGAVFDLSNLSKSQRKTYKSMIKNLSSSKLFEQMYKEMSNSKEIFVVKIDPSIRLSNGVIPAGKFRPRSSEEGGGTITLKSLNETSTLFAQEAFHGYQWMNREIYGGNPFSSSNSEFEGDLFETYVAFQSGALIKEHEFLGPILDLDYGEVPSSKELKSKKYTDLYLKQTKERVKFFKEMEKNNQKSSPTYTMLSNSSMPYSIIQLQEHLENSQKTKVTLTQAAVGGATEFIDIKNKH